MTIVSDCILYDKMSYSVILYCLLLFSVIMQVSSCADVKLWRRVFGFRVWGSGFGILQFRVLGIWVKLSEGTFVLRVRGPQA